MGDWVTLVDGAMVVIELWETGGAMLLGGSMGWHGNMVIVEAVKLGGMAINEAVGPEGVAMGIAIGSGGVAIGISAGLDGMAINEAIV